MPLHVLSTCVHHQEVKIALHKLWYHHTFYMFRAHVLIIRRSKLHYTTSGIITHTSTCFEHMCSSSGGQNCITHTLVSSHLPLHVSSTCAYYQEVKIALHSLWYHHTCRCDDTRVCVMQFWPPDDEHMCSKHVEAWNKLIVKQKFCASRWLITEINIMRCMVSKT